MSIINEYLVMLELKDSKEKLGEHSPCNLILFVFFFFLFFLGGHPLSFSLLYCLLFPVIGLSSIIFLSGW